MPPMPPIPPPPGIAGESFFGCSAIMASSCPRVVLAIFHAQFVRVEEEHGIVVVVILARRADDGRAGFLKKCLQLVHIPAAAQLEGIVVKPDVTDAILVLSALRVRGADPEARVAIGSPDRVLVF